MTLKIVFDYTASHSQLSVQEREDANLSDWDRFARTEYIRLAMEEEGEEAEPESSTDLWESSVTESAF